MAVNSQHRAQSIIGKTHLLSLGLVAVVSWVILLFGRTLITGVVSDYFFELPSTPYFVINDVFRLYLITPLVIAAGILTWFLPGIYLTLIFGKTRRFTELVVWAFGLSTILYLLNTQVVKLLSPGMAPSGNFIAGIILAGGITWSGLAVSVFKDKELFWPLAGSVDWRRLLWVIGIPLLALLLLFPVIFWQDMHGDAVEAFELGRSLSQFLWPRFPSPQGVAGLGIGMLPMAYPVHWFIVLFGEIEASARLPVIVYLPVIFCLLVELIEWQAPRRLGIIEESLLVLTMAIVTVTLSYNASYDPYFSDMASPMAIDLFEIIAIMAAIYFLWRQNWFFLTMWSMLAFLGRPTGILVMGLITIGVLILFPEKRKVWGSVLIGLIISFLLLGVIYDKVLLPALSGATDFGFQSDSIIERIRYIRLFEFLRLDFGIFPVGILPFLALFFFKWQDNYSRLISFITLGYYLIFLFVAFTALHHFIPVMILPMVVFWRMVLLHPAWNKKVLYPAVAIAGIASLFLSLPRSFTINRTARMLGQKIRIDISDYKTDYKKLISHTDIFTKIVRPDWFVDDPSEELISTPLAMIYYGTRSKQEGTPVNYLIQDISKTAPPGFTLIASDQTASLFVKNLEEWHAYRFQEWDTAYRSPLYAISRGTLYYYRVVTKGTVVIDIIEVLGKLKHRLFDA